ncbi:MAG: tRNA preQ1(34) S-adenosylmethionine ribosyltransferase-isomerase QueA [Cyclobacteriaceae bacterium]|nr:tRNA preQ1(34) S-adenosylmethionine ribosyltransferase-isomerase QueA [Cyclobacteriaceae bacterium SS2]
MNWNDLNLKDYQYNLPPGKVAKYPLKERSASKLLFYKAGEISHYIFKDIVDLIPPDALLVSNDTRVIPARLVFQKETGAHIEIFLLDPVEPSPLHEETLNSKGSCTWKCMIGNAKRWKGETPLTYFIKEGVMLEAIKKDEQQVIFMWPPLYSFSEILQMVGKVPLPPYLKREMNDEDKPRYQTVYSKYEGAVAAPTAGLHFSDDVMAKLQAKGISQEYLTLHVSSGTFMPMKSSVEEHPMHNEQVVITQSLIERLLEKNKVIPVGTTSMRTLESLYWYGVKIALGDAEFHISKMMPYYANKEKITLEESLNNVLSVMKEKGESRLLGNTEIFIFPGYEFKICKGLITNFHLPSSTLILLVAAFVGNDWKRIYDEALKKDYRFLSYGDSSLLIPDINSLN